MENDADLPGGEDVALRLDVGGRVIGHVRLRLTVVGHHLCDLLEPRGLDLPPAARDGWLLRSLPLAQRDRLAEVRPDQLIAERQRYPRHYVPMAGQGFDDWWGGFSSKTRSTLRRKARRLAEAFEGGFSISAYRTPAEMAAFMAAVAPLSARTYQARRLDAALPTDAAAVEAAIVAAEADALRAFLLFAGERPIAYLYLPVVGNTLIYAYLGYDPEHADLSPGTVLHVEAMRALFAEGRFDAFDFTEGDGAHKAQFGRASIECVDMLVLRPTMRNRAALMLLRAVDGTAHYGKALLARTRMAATARALLRR